MYAYLVFFLCACYIYGYRVGGWLGVHEQSGRTGRLAAINSTLLAEAGFFSWL